MFGLDAGDRENVITERKDRTYKKSVFIQILRSHLRWRGEKFFTAFKRT